MFKVKTGLALLLLFTLALANGQQQGFHFKRKVNGPGEEGWYVLPLPPDVFKAVRNDLSDIRLYHIKGTDTTEIQYVARTLQDVVEEVQVDLAVFNKSKKDGKFFLTAELNKDQKVNQLELSFVEGNFNGFVQLEGSNDQAEWFKVDSLQRILSIHNENINFHSTTIHFPLSNYRYLRLGIQADKPLTFSNVSFKRREVVEGVHTEPVARWKSSTDKKTKQTELQVTLDALQPITRLTIEEEHSMDFYRPITVEVLRDSAQTPKGWTYYYDLLYSGYITSLDNHTFDLSYTLAKKLRITVHNADNPSLNFKKISVTGPQVELAAKWPADDNYILYGNASLGAPSYDVAHFTDKIPKDLQALSLGEVENLIAPVEKSSPFFESKVWLWALMGVIIGVLGYFTMKMMRAKE